MKQMNNKKKHKVVLLGSAAVGKSSILRRLVEDLFNPFEESTIGAAFYTKTFPNHDLKLDLWDTAGQERYANLAPMYYRGAHVIVSVYDVTSKKSFTEALKWIQTACPIDIAGNSKVISALVGNKADVCNSDREVTTEMGERCTRDKLGLATIFMETSAKTGKNINVLFDTICEKLKNDYPADNVNDWVNPGISFQTADESTCKCT
jgi:Ras-related protein Rab-5C